MDIIGFDEIRENFRKFMKKNIQEQLELNYKNNLEDCLTSAFVLCGKGNPNTKFKIYELCWKFGSNGLELEREKDVNLFYSGSGSIYLNKINSEINSDNYWGSLDILQAKSELENLFLEAVNQKNELGGNKFSDNFDMCYIST